MILQLATTLDPKPLISRRAIRKSLAIHALMAMFAVTYSALHSPLAINATASSDPTEGWELSATPLIEVPGTPSCDTRWEQLRDGRVLEVSLVHPPDRIDERCQAKPAALFWAPPVAEFHPRQAITDGVAGRVWVSVLVDRHGRVAEATPVADMNPGWQFSTAAVAAVRERRYRPLKIDGRAVASRFTDVVDFGPAAGDEDRR